MSGLSELAPKEPPAVKTPIAEASSEDEASGHGEGLHKAEVFSDVDAPGCSEEPSDCDRERESRRRVADSGYSTANEVPLAEISVGQASPGNAHGPCCGKNSNRCDCEPGENGCCGACPCNGRSKVCICESEGDEDLCGCCGCCPRKTFNKAASGYMTATNEADHIDAATTTTEQLYTCNSAHKAGAIADNASEEYANDELSDHVTAGANTMTPETLAPIAEAAASYFTDAKDELHPDEATSSTEELRIGSLIEMQTFKAVLRARLSEAELSNFCKWLRTPEPQGQMDTKELEKYGCQEAQEARPDLDELSEYSEDLDAERPGTVEGFLAGFKAGSPDQELFEYFELLKQQKTGDRSTSEASAGPVSGEVNSASKHAAQISRPDSGLSTRIEGVTTGNAVRTEKPLLVPQVELPTADTTEAELQQPFTILGVQSKESQTDSKTSGPLLPKEAETASEQEAGRGQPHSASEHSGSVSGDRHQSSRTERS